ncbi:MAG: aminoacyl-tRNA hydrolase [Candidatus Omnitrophica bacterium]|nr:aminoacyl-tRNA hydrolase [Candidatus Omnitrophota bacterium]
MKVIVGLGNVGDAYAHTRHNAGWDVVVALAGPRAAWQPLREGREVLGRYCELTEGGLRVRLLLPETLMNASGRAVAAAATAWHIQVEQGLLLVCDDVNLPLGVVRLRPQGSDGGHHGLASCFEALKTLQVARMRVGVGRAPLPRDLTEFVLSPFRSEEQAVVDQACRIAVDGCRVWARDGMKTAMNRVNPAPGGGVNAPEAKREGVETDE